MRIDSRFEPLAAAWVITMSVWGSPNGTVRRVGPPEALPRNFQAPGTVGGPR